jgi:hypothetical protein
VEWYGVFASAAAPAAAIASLAKRISHAVTQPALADAARRIEVTPRPVDGADLQRLLQADAQRWKSAVQSTGIQLESWGRPAPGRCLGCSFTGVPAIRTCSPGTDGPREHVDASCQAVPSGSCRCMRRP